MSQVQMPPTGVPEPEGRGDQSKNWMAIVAAVLGGVNLLSWCLPICGFPLAIAGMVFGILGIKSSLKGLSIAGLIVSGFALLLTLVNAAVGVYINLSHK